MHDGEVIHSMLILYVFFNYKICLSFITNLHQLQHVLLIICDHASINQTYAAEV